MRPGEGERAEAGGESRGLWRTLDRWCIVVGTWGIAVSALCMLIAGVLGSLDIVTTVALSAPIPITVELSSYLMAFIVFGAFAHAQQRHEHVAIDVLVKMLPARVQYACRVFSLVAGLVVFGLLAWRGLALFVDSYAMGETAAASIPFIVWPFKLGAFLFLALGTMEFVRQLVWSLLGREWLPPHPAVSEEIAR